jgi:hypothetical protein
MKCSSLSILVFLGKEHGADPRVQGVERARSVATGREHKRVRAVEADSRVAWAGASADTRGGGRAEGAILPIDGRGGSLLSGRDVLVSQHKL